MTKSKGRWILAALITAFLLAFAAWPVRVLILESEKSRPLILTVEQRETITLQYVHSVYHVLQREIYEPVGNELVLRSMYFGDMSAALYYDAYALYPLEPEPAGGYTIREPNLHFPAISFALGHGTQYEIYIGAKRPIDLDKTFEDATFLTVRPDVMPWGEYFLRRLSNGNR
ncbi:MAG: DUF1850 domain-containing protein [Sporomusaceae bacterium]|nr:DUF1850 domain-containing protein [Sporomusaceae bacterium]